MDGIVTCGTTIETATNSRHGEVAEDTIDFDLYDYLNRTTRVVPDRHFSPIVRVPAFWSLLSLNAYVNQKQVPKRTLPHCAAMYEQLVEALSFVSYVCGETEKETRNGRRILPEGGERKNLLFFRSNHSACEACIKLITLLPHSTGASGATLVGFFNFLNVFLDLLSKVQPNQQLVVPGGWQQPDSTYLCLYTVRNNGPNQWSFTVCNTGKDGLQYHPTSVDLDTGRESKQRVMTIGGKSMMMALGTYAGIQKILTRILSSCPVCLCLCQIFQEIVSWIRRSGRCCLDCRCTHPERKTPLFCIRKSFQHSVHVR
jgi:hypothetical protein